MRAPQPAPVPEEVDYDSAYKVKQYGTNGLITGGLVAATVFMFAPEPLVTKIIGGILSLVCIAAGGVGKHVLYKGAYVHRALEKALIKLQEQLVALDFQIRLLEETNKDLTDVNTGLTQTREDLQAQVGSLKGEIGRLEKEIVDAFTQLNSDRADFEKQKTRKLSQLIDEIDEADARGDRATEELQSLLARATQLDALEDELNRRRKKVAASESNLRSLQQRLLSVIAEGPQTTARRKPRRAPSPSTPAPESPRKTSSHSSHASSNGHRTKGKRSRTRREPSNA